MSPTMPEMPKVPLPPPPALDPQGKKPQRKSMQPTFLGADAVPQGASSGKTLLGQ